MCGITGFYSLEGRFTRENLEQMILALEHRGPDASGLYFNKMVGLGHRRLSIIDLSESANQPMYSHCKRYVMVYNGEVYNFKEVSQELQKQCSGLKFDTSSDTEVLLEAFAKWGIEFVNKLNGMFVIAIYDTIEKSLYLFRDRVGIKPLYYFWDGENFAFSSEIKALLRCSFIKDKCKINSTAVTEYLYLGYIPEPHSIYNKIYKFPSGSYATFKNTEFQINKYWDINNKISENILLNECDAKRQLKELIISSVKYRLISDVPFGTFLSGGIDSSLVTAVAQSVSDNPINTFSIGFKESKYNESVYAGKVAEYLKTNHHEFIVSEQDAMELIPSLPIVYDEPFADGSSIPTMLVSKLARQYVTMTLSGDGGDELFMGYGAYNWASRLSKPLIHLLRKPVANILSLGNSRFKRVSNLFKYDDKKHFSSHIFSQEQYFFSQGEIVRILNSEFYNEFILNENIVNNKRILTPAEKQSIFDLKYYLKDDLLVKVDRASMKYSLETRVPLLDYRIIEFALNLTPELKINNNVQKYLLKEVLYDYIPKSYFNRAKWGFALPIGKWLKKDLKYLLDIYLSEEIINKYGVINYNYTQKLIKQFFSGNNYLYNRLWALIVLHLWLENKK